MPTFSLPPPFFYKKRKANNTTLNTFSPIVALLLFFFFSSSSADMWEDGALGTRVFIHMHTEHTHTPNGTAECIRVDWMIIYPLLSFLLSSSVLDVRWEKAGGRYSIFPHYVRAAKVEEEEEWRRRKSQTSSPTEKGKKDKESRRLSIFFGDGKKGETEKGFSFLFFLSLRFWKVSFDVDLSSLPFSLLSIKPTNQPMSPDTEKQISEQTRGGRRFNKVSATDGMAPP